MRTLDHSLKGSGAGGKGGLGYRQGEESGRRWSAWRQGSSHCSSHGWAGRAWRGPPGAALLAGSPSSRRFANDPVIEMSPHSRFVAAAGADATIERRLTAHERYYRTGVPYQRRLNCIKLPLEAVDGLEDVARHAHPPRISTSHGEISPVSLLVVWRPRVGQLRDERTRTAFCSALPPWAPMRPTPPRSRGSSRSRTASPNMLKLYTTMVRKMPGHMASHGACCM